MKYIIGTILCFFVEFCASMFVAGGKAGFFVWLLLSVSILGAIYFILRFLDSISVYKTSMSPKIIGGISSVIWIVGVVLLAYDGDFSDTVALLILVILLIAPYLIYASLVCLFEKKFIFTLLFGVLKFVSSIFYYISLPNIPNISIVYIVINALLIVTLIAITIKIEKDERWKAFLNSIINGSLENATHWLESGGDVNAKTSDKETLLILACEAERFDMVELLVEKGGDINKADSFGYTPLKCAVNLENDKIVTFLLEKGADPTYKYSFDLVDAVKLNDRNKIDSLLEKGANLEYKDSEGKSALYYAAIEKNDVDLATKLLVKDGVFINKYENKNIGVFEPLITALINHKYR